MEISPTKFEKTSNEKSNLKRIQIRLIHRRKWIFYIYNILWDNIFSDNIETVGREPYI